jgi:hypothetical protein
VARKFPVDQKGRGGVRKVGLQWGVDLISGEVEGLKAQNNHFD